MCFYSYTGGPTGPPREGRGIWPNHSTIKSLRSCTPHPSTLLNSWDISLCIQCKCLFLYKLYRWLGELPVQTTDTRGQGEAAYKLPLPPRRRQRRAPGPGCCRAPVPSRQRRDRRQSRQPRQPRAIRCGLSHPGAEPVPQPLQRSISSKTKRWPRRRSCNV